MNNPQSNPDYVSAPYEESGIGNPNFVGDSIVHNLQRFSSITVRLDMGVDGMIRFHIKQNESVHQSP